MIYDSLTQLIGNTPMLRVNLPNLNAKIVLKMECFNPGGSVKDRTALAMIENAEQRGTLTQGATIVEPTSGNTGVGLAWIGRLKGYRVVLTMPETMSQERRSLLQAYGAELVLTPGDQGMQGAIDRANEICRDTSNAVILGQFENPANPAIHARTTGEEIWRDTQGDIDIFVAGAGTGGTVSGVGEALKRHNSAVQIVAVEPATSAVLSGKAAGSHKIQGIGAGFVPKTYNPDVVDTVMPITDDEAMTGLRTLVQTQGLLAGISSGAAFSAALKLAQMPENAGKTIVALLPDTGERYLSVLSGK